MLFKYLTYIFCILYKPLTGYTGLRFHSRICFFPELGCTPIFNPHHGGPGFVFGVFSPRWVSFSVLIEALLPLVLFQGFPSLSLWGFFPSPTRPVVTYSSETWTLTAKYENNLCIFERQILRKIFGPVNIDNIWRIRNNMESDKLIESEDIVRFIKAQRIKGWGISNEWTEQDQLGSC